ncbi:hypothetical protein [Aequorivita echinoideorum]|uniref:Dolichyl-phosphate-mannose-protein mannosyltransferase n=1 Tax=Aequorivita echinoideorum TaxID=1549647 RepID=A0ABS5S8U0_9FLAO|nr:hypothetical protein [Aequorivita echinoideorum]MBT0608834.1 hypothetical protein [Aequorivita echinoideorum]
MIFLLYAAVFGYFVFQPAIISPDTHSYWHLDIVRYPVYVLFLRGFEFIFGENYEPFAVAFQLVFTLISVQIFSSNFSRLLKLHFVLQLLLVGILLFPIFPPLLTANNLCSEGLSYPLYLLMVSFAVDFLFKNEKRKIYFFAIAFIALALTRGQFAIIAVIVAFLFILKHKKFIFRKVNLKFLLLLLLLPFISNMLDSTYRKLVHNHFITAPYSFVNAVTLPLFISEEKDSLLFENEDQKIIFQKTYHRIDSLGLLSSKVEGDYKAKYQVFHDNFPYICNQSFHDIGRKHFRDKNDPFQSSIDTEIAAKAMFFPLVKTHLKDYISLYYTSVMHGFYSFFIFLFFVLVCIFSGIKLLKKFTLEYGIIFFGSLLILSNALIVAVAVHTIMRYVFYNFALAFIILILLLKKATFAK